MQHFKAELTFLSLMIHLLTALIEGPMVHIATSVPLEDKTPALVAAVDIVNHHLRRDDVLLHYLAQDGVGRSGAKLNPSTPALAKIHFFKHPP